MVLLPSVVLCSFSVSLLGGGAVGSVDGFSFLCKVSGRAKMMKISVMPPYMTRNHCVDRQPSPEPKAPPMMGAKSGPQSGPR